MSSLKIKTLLAFLFIIPPILFADNPSQFSIKDIYVINSLSDRLNTAESGSIKILEHSQIEDWARARGLEIIPDRGPVIDNSALYLLDFRGIFSVTSLKKDKQYKLRIDFVKFRRGNNPLLSHLKLYIRDKKGVEHFLIRLDKNVLFEKKIFETSVPFRFSYEGEFELILYEYSEVPGMWGIWDIIIYPADIDIDSIQRIEPGTDEESMKHNLKIFY
jgi:hypothetical protein